jgi:hypothetical protein
MARSLRMECEHSRVRKAESNTCGACGIEISDAEILCSECKPALAPAEIARAAYAGTN